MNGDSTTIKRWFRSRVKRPLLVLLTIVIVATTVTISIWVRGKIESRYSSLLDIRDYVAVGVTQKNRTLIEALLSNVVSQLDARQAMLCDGQDRALISLPGFQPVCDITTNFNETKLIASVTGRDDLKLVAVVPVIPNQNSLAVLFAISLFGLLFAVMLLRMASRSLESDLVHPLSSFDLNMRRKPGSTSRILEIDALFSKLLEQVAHIERMSKEKQQQAKLIAIARTTQMLAHDVRKPFSLLQTGLSLLRAANNEDELRSRLDQVEKRLKISLKHVNGMLSDVLEVGAERKPTLNPLNLNEVLDDCIELIKDTTNCRGIDFSLLCHPDHIPLGEEPKISRVIQNILGNAVQAMKGKGSIFMTSERQNDAIEISIRNTGSFIPEEKRDQVFDAFHTEGKKGGTGLGLAIVKKIVEDHGGRVWCLSDEGEGTTFGFSLQAAQMESEVPVATGANSTGNSKEDIRIVVVEDDPFLQDAWHEANPDVVVYDSPESFLDDLDRGDADLRHFDALVTDYHFGSESTMTGADLIAYVTAEVGRIKLFYSSDSVESKGTHIESLPKNPSEAIEIINSKALSRNYGRQIEP